MKIADPLGRGRPDRRDLHPADFARVIVELEKHFEKRVDAIRAGEYQPIVTVRVLHKLAELTQLGGRLNANRR